MKVVVDAEIEELTEGEEESAQEKLKQEWARVEAVVGTESRLRIVAADLVEHFERRIQDHAGKGMIVCMSRRICVELYNALVKIRPDWHSEDDDAGALKIVMTGSASDPEHFQPHIGKRPKQRLELLAKRLKDPDDPLTLVIVRDMWLTGFDAPCLHTLYIDKPMKGHGLMQAIARVNRVFRDKPGGLVVDYIGIAQNLKAALAQYSKADQNQTGIDADIARAVLQEKYETVRLLLHGCDYSRAFARDATSAEKLAALAAAVDHVLSPDFIQFLATPEQVKADAESALKEARQTYSRAVQELTKAYALAVASDYAREIRDEVAFFQAVRSALESDNRSTGTGKSLEAYSRAVQQIISRAVVSTDIIDILSAAGIQKPNIGILSDEFLNEVRQMQLKNLAIEALRKLLNGEIRLQGQRNVAQARKFSERLAEAIARYHSNAITTVQVMDELIELAKDIREAQHRGEELQLSDEEVAFYDALSEHDNAVALMKNEDLLLIARELFEKLRGSVTVDWMHREQVRAKIRVEVKRILKKYGYPPDLEQAAIQNVLQQAEVLAYRLAVELV
mgnify:CR=1 FL=1